MENKLYELCRHRRSIRRYLPKRIGDEVIREILMWQLNIATLITI